MLSVNSQARVRRTSGCYPKIRSPPSLSTTDGGVRPLLPPPTDYGGNNNSSNTSQFLPPLSSCQLKYTEISVLMLGKFGVEL
ncbi:hypothetical protein RHMOL_Rhmol08G0313200 [Rhododendron molle]|uniref:Uncharacterized protein n=2 Tax=Rhododendron molle TaxID=49168 RepID=A0ACC0MUU5_RHOML|nr:hypothetical protein RHMOL_Rhmol08G0313200 [Rhododendron molle]KAI8544665.1 hypothetical protein RHMOL_Rhmol08G0313200 [Rhododendron molle]